MSRRTMSPAQQRERAVITNLIRLHQAQRSKAPPTVSARASSKTRRPGENREQHRARIKGESDV
jgi:hypothetical protein